MKEDLEACPVKDCHFSGTSKDISSHLEGEHKWTDKEIGIYFQVDPGIKEKPLVEAAKKLNAISGTPDTPGYQESDEMAKTKSIKQALGDGKVYFHPEKPRIEWSELVSQQFIIKDVRIVEDWDSHFGTSDFPLLLVQLNDGREMTTLGSGIAVLKQCKKLRLGKLLPVKAKLVRVPPTDYYMLE